MKLSTILASLLAAFAAGGGVAVATDGGLTSSTGSPAGEISGPCDEAEHADDPRCTGIAPTGDTVDDDGPDDMSGPCDEAEHADDPRCTGVAALGSSGPGSGHDGSGRSGNSGPGGGGGDDSSGRGSGDSWEED